MVDPEEMRGRARRVYGRRRGDWVRGIVADGLDRRDVGTVGDAVSGTAPGHAGIPGTVLEVNLVPPTRRDVLQDIAGVGEWVGRWEDYAGPGEVIWEDRRWPSVGTQRIPVRVRLDDIEAIARAARRWDEWRGLASRARDLARLAVEWRDDPPRDPSDPSNPTDVPDVARRLTSVIASTTDRDWEMTLEVLRWLHGHRDLSHYIRELPIRGIDTKWIEDHRRLVLGLARPLLRLDALPFRQPPELIRVRALDVGIVPRGFEDASLTATELSALETLPTRIVVCENLISVLTMPAMEGTLVLFGSGYGVGSRLAIPWLDEVELYYWGDLDTHGFRILDGFRRHHPGAVSVLMDMETLRGCQDLWVTEPEPFTGALTRLTDAEAEVYDFLRQQEPIPRLEQERIPYHQVNDAFESIALPSNRRSG